MTEVREDLLVFQQGENQNFPIDSLKVKEKLEPIQLKNLRIIVHPSHLIRNPNANFGGRTNWDAYMPKTREMQANAQTRFAPGDETDVTLIMPHEEPTLESLQISDRKKTDPNDVMWTDLYETIKKSTPFPKNVAIIGDLTDYYYRSEPKQQRKDVESKIVTKLQEIGFEINEDTVITLGGEFRDVCVYEVARKLLFFLQINRLKIDKVASFTTAYHYITVLNPETEDLDRHESLIESLKQDGFQVREDDEFVFVEKKLKAESMLVA